jgi:hypothetical protein
MMEQFDIPEWMRLVVPDERSQEERLTAVVNTPAVSQLINGLSGWESAVLKSHKTTDHILHQAVFLTDIGLSVAVPEIKTLMDSVLRHVSSEGILQTRIQIQAAYGGSGEADWHWMLCDAPLVFTLALKSGASSVGQVADGIAFMVDLHQDDGWPCRIDPLLGKFRGPGKSSDLCPYATLLMLKLMSLHPQYQDHELTRQAGEGLLSLWDQRKVHKPYLFAMGTDFQKLKAPLIWYDLLHFLDVMTRYQWARSTPQIQEMIAILHAKQDANGQFTPESIYRPWADWEFGQKKVPSVWITYLAQRILSRMDA